MSVKIAMYIGKGKVGNSAIRWWTGARESHCELVVNGLSYSSSIMDGGVRRKYIEFNEENWYFMDVPWASDADVIRHYESTKQNKYGWMSLIKSQIFNRNNDDVGSDFCSEWCARALKIPSPNSYSPSTLAHLIRFLNENKFSMRKE